MTYTFKKAERLGSKTLIEKLFKSGRSFTTDPFRITWLEFSLNTGHPAQIAFAVPKKNFRRAVDRNKLKRRAREAYRKNKSRLYDNLKEQSRSIILMLVYIAKEPVSQAVIDTKINTIIDRLIRERGDGSTVK
ncbi:MAG: ribonuclease P protein component [Bacteroidetes bacterium]|nr:ribonuclease P protein component [Bacteroidota bacterium]